MSDDKKPGLGLFINRKNSGNSAAPAAPAASSKQKDVKKRWIYVGVATIGTVVLGSSLLAPQEQSKGPAKPKTPTTISVDPPKSEERRFESQISTELTGLRQELDQVKAASAAKEAELQRLREQKAATPTPPASGTVVLPPTENGGGLGVVGSNGGPPAPPVPPAQTQVPTFKPPSIAPAANTGAGTPPNIPEIPATSMPAPSADPLVFDAPGASSGNGSGDAAKNSPRVNAKASYRKNESAGMLPAGAFAPVVLLNGLDAGTSSATQSNPMPVLMNVQDQATLPGAAKYRLKNCFVLGTGYGDLSAERVYVRFSRLSCVDKNDRLVLSQEVGGYVVDSDGKLGLRGKVMDRQGAKLGKAMLAGFAQGLAGALGQSQSTVTSSLTTGTSMSSISGGAALRASGLGGAQLATSQLAEFYLKEAQAIFPVISVDTGRTATIVFTNSASLNWGNGDSQYVQEVKPSN